MLKKKEKLIMFNAIYKPNQLIIGTGYIAICTGWTPAKSVASKLDPSDYAVIGNLYSASRGINFLVRNLLANPHVRDLVVMDSTREDKNSGSVQCLKDFFENGVYRGKNDVGKPCWVIDSLVKGYIDVDIPLEVLNQLRSSVTLRDSLTTYAILATVYGANKPWAEPMVFPYNEPTSEVEPGPLYGHRIEGKTIAETWIKILQRIKTTGTIRPTGYDGKWQELIDLMAIVTDEPEDFYFPEPNYLPLDREYLKNYIPQILDDADYREGVKYTYGQRLRSWFGQDQIEQVINKLVKEIDSASAVMSLWDSGTGGSNESNLYQTIRRYGRDGGDSDHNHGGSPCLNHIWVRVVDNEVSLTATFRSNDMFSAWPANAMGLRALQHHIRDEIASQSEYNLTLGPLITISQSAHIYDDCWENVEQLINNQYQAIINQEFRSYSDPTGNFLVETDGNNITVSQLTPIGEFVRKWEGKNPLKLIRQIVADCPSIQPFHIGYLAREIERASQQKTNYTQDK
ncbi:thymidylate synthase [uncultured phage]|nr:thymidylate synthase [uncultured phage]